MTRSFPRRTALAVLLAAPLTLAACADGADERPDTPETVAEATGETHTMPDGTEMDGAEHEHIASADGEAASPEMVDGVQVIEIEAGRMGYQPRQIALEAGVPARLVFTRTVEGECSSQITIPAYDVPTTDLPLGEPVAVEFTPAEAGEVEFVCGMDMQRGTIAIAS
ncbi:MAG: cupredoxin domain-containing protein [Bacteroidota bacterium]